MSTSFYDVIVLGSDLGATVGGAILAHRGFRVLVAGVPSEERYSIGPYNLPRTPLAVVGSEATMLKRIVAELNLVQLLRRRLEPNRPAYQLLLPGHRLDVGDELAREIGRELPDALPAFDTASARVAEVAAAVEAILSQDLILPPDGFWDRRDVNRIAARLPNEEEDLLAPLPPDHLARALFTVPARFAAASDPPTTVGIARLGELHRRGTCRLDGGREGLRALLLDRLQTHSGELRKELTPTAIYTKRGKVSAVAFDNGRIEFGCGHVIAGLDAERVAALVSAGGERPPKRLAESAATPIAAHRYQLHLVAPLDALPDALGRLAFAVADWQRPLSGANALMLHLADGYGRHAVMTVEALAIDPSPEGLRTLRREIREQLAAQFPFLDRHLLVVHSPHDGLAPEGEGESLPAPAPVPMEPVWRMEEPLLGFCGIPHASGVKQLLFASRQTLPSLGLEGELAAGWTAARLVMQAERKRDLVSGAVIEGG